MKLFSISRAAVERRWLMPAYRFQSSLMAWECSVCGKLFYISIEEAEVFSTQLPPPHIEQDFQVHSCELHLRGRFPDMEIYPAERGPEEARHEIRTTAYGRIRG